MKSFTIWGLLVRWLAAVFLVFATYNPSGRSFFHWVFASDYDLWALKAAAGMALAAGLIVFTIASLRSLGLFGMVLCGAVLSSFLWALHDTGVLTPTDRFAEEMSTLLFIASVLGIGVSWSHVKQRLSGQVDSNDVTNPA